MYALLVRYHREKFVRIDVFNPLLHDTRLPSGFEGGANEMFRWGGYTKGGMPEAVNNSLRRDSSEYSINKIEVKNNK